MLKIFPLCSLLFLTLLFYSSSSTAAYSKFEVDSEVTIRKKATKGTHLVVAVQLQAGSVIEIDKNKHAGLQEYQNDAGQIRKSNNGWFYDVRLPENEFSQFKQDSLYLSETHLADLVEIISTPTPLTPKTAWMTIKIDSLVTLRKLVKKNGLSYLQKVMDVTAGSTLKVRLKNDIGILDYMHSSGQIRTSRLSWIQGVRIERYSGKIAKSTLDNANQEVLYVSSEILDFIDDGKKKPGKQKVKVANPYPKLIEIHTEDKTKCLPNKIWKILKKTAEHFGQKVQIVSAHRNREDNKRRGGARRSEHIRCRAVDIVIPGVAGADLGSFLANQRGRGGVGFYCTDRIHLDIGKCRQWGACAPQKFRCR